VLNDFGSSGHPECHGAVLKHGWPLTRLGREDGPNDAGTRSAWGIVSMERNEERPLRICLLSYRSNPHCGSQGVYLKNLAIALKGLGTTWRW
jgi:hypothetical protein